MNPISAPTFGKIYEFVNFPKMTEGTSLQGVMGVLSPLVADRYQATRPPEWEGDSEQMIPNYYLWNADEGEYWSFVGNDYQLAKNLHQAYIEETQHFIDLLPEQKQKTLRYQRVQEMVAKLKAKTKESIEQIDFKQFSKAEQLSMVQEWRRSITGAFFFWPN